MVALGSLPLWFLSVIALAGTTFPVWRISRIGRHSYIEETPAGPETPGSASSVPDPPPQTPVEPESAQQQTRLMKWISIDEFMTLLGNESNHPVVVDLRPDSLWTPFPVPDAFVLRLTPHDLVDVLAWLPGDRSVVFYGASSFCIFLIEISVCMEGSAPLYFLERDFCRLEAA